MDDDVAAPAGVAVVDDDAELGELLRRELVARGYDTRAFTSPEACLEAMIAGYRPRLLLLDPGVRGLSGATFVRVIRKAAWGATLPVYIISPSRYAHGAPAPGSVQGWLPKPFRLEHVLRVARTHLGPREIATTPARS